MTKYAAQTEVTSTRSRDEIERTLERYGADQFMYGSVSYTHLTLPTKRIV